MQRAALYARVSTDLQEKEQTIQSQLAVITGYAERHGFRHSTALTYTDDGYSGTWLDRPGLDELRDHAREGRFEVVVVLCPDRLARRYAYQVLLLEELKRAGVAIHFCERPINDSPDDQLLLQIQGAIAEYERAKVLERCRRGRLHRARRGELAPPNPPYGYHYAARKYGGDGQIRIHEEEAAMVRQAFRWYAEEGASLYGLLKKLNASAWTTRSGKNEWTATSVLHMLHCEWYVGRAYYNRVTRRPVAPVRDAEGTPRPRCVKVERPRSEWIMVPVPRLVDDELFNRVQERIQENKRFSRRRLKRARVYLLKGLVKCGLCGYAYIGMTRTAFPKRDGQREHSYYVCAMRSTLRQVGCTTRCQGERLLVAGADEVVWATVRDLLLDSDALAEKLQSWLARTTADPEGDERLSLTTARLSELNRQRKRLIDAYQTGALDLDDFQTRKTTVEEGILTVEHEVAVLRSWASRRDLASRQVISAQDVVRQLRDRLQDPSFELKQAILRLVVEKVIVSGRRLEIHLALPVSGSFDLTSGWGAGTHPSRNGGPNSGTDPQGRLTPNLRQVYECCNLNCVHCPRRDLLEVPPLPRVVQAVSDHQGVELMIGRLHRRPLGRKRFRKNRGDNELLSSDPREPADRADCPHHRECLTVRAPRRKWRA